MSRSLQIDPDSESTPGVNKWLVAFTVLFGTFMAVMDISVVNVSMPHMMGTFSEDLSSITWVATAYSIAEIIMVTMAGWQTNEVFYDDVTVPKENLVGDLNAGFFYVMHALDYERMFPLATYGSLVDEVAEYARTKIVDGEPLAKRGKMSGSKRLSIKAKTDEISFSSAL